MDYPPQQGWIFSYGLLFIFSNKQTIMTEDKTKQDSINLYYSTLSAILYEVRKQFGKRTYEVYRLYLLCDMTYDEINRIKGLRDSEDRIMEVNRWLNGNKI